ncbi:MAG: hypothetical protein L7H18_04555 [Candidatus Nealsonbacteria bacterium DGGOD1a]|jgi:hypothetical protein|nr:MAG: hypothetical protein L7H18_04555 [Candidatus Nealsonbacteria bacterium DGGOD1a]
MENKISNKAWVVCVNMGYGHQRTAHPLKGLAHRGQIINANDYQGIPKSDKKIWEDSRRFYEAISRFKRIPLVGGPAFSLYDGLFQKIIEFYPNKDLSRPPILAKSTYGLIKKGWGRHFIAKLAKNPMPLVTTFFIAAFMAEEFDYPGDIYLVVCDADVSRQWAALDPMSSRINYCAPNARVAARLKLYGVPKRRIFLTGYPLPEGNIFSGKDVIGGMDVAKADLGRRLANLDPAGIYLSKYGDLAKKTLGDLPRSAGRLPAIMFSAGGAGAQSEIGLEIARQLAPRIREGKMKLVLSAGTNKKLKKLFQNAARGLRLEKNPNLEILFEEKIGNYFNRFNKTLRKVDILWTKPSELSFYSALGVPIIVAPPIGSQEDFNKSWLLRSGFGIEQGDMNCIGQWLDDWLFQGYLAEAAMEGFIEGEKLGTYHIERLVANKGKLN